MSYAKIQVTLLMYIELKLKLFYHHNYESHPIIELKKEIFMK